MSELGLTPVSRARVAVPNAGTDRVDRIEIACVHVDKDGRRVETVMGDWNDISAAAARSRRIGDPIGEETSQTGKVTRIELDSRL